MSKHWDEAKIAAVAALKEGKEDLSEVSQMQMFIIIKTKMVVVPSIACYFKAADLVKCQIATVTVLK